MILRSETKRKKFKCEDDTFAFSNEWKKSLAASGLEIKFDFAKCKVHRSM